MPGLYLWHPQFALRAVVAGPTPVPWGPYAVTTFTHDGVNATTDEICWEKGDLMYWRTYKMAVGKGDTEIRDVLAGLLYKQ